MSRSRWRLVQPSLRLRRRVWQQSLHLSAYTPASWPSGGRLPAGMRKSPPGGRGWREESVLSAWSALGRVCQDAPSALRSHWYGPWRMQALAPCRPPGVVQPSVLQRLSLDLVMCSRQLHQWHICRASWALQRERDMTAARQAEREQAAEPAAQAGRDGGGIHRALVVLYATQRPACRQSWSVRTPRASRSSPGRRPSCTSRRQMPDSHTDSSSFLGLCLLAWPVASKQVVVLPAAP